MRPFQYAAQNRMVTAVDYSTLVLKNFGTLIKDIQAFGGQDALKPEFGRSRSYLLHLMMMYLQRQKLQLRLAFWI